MEGYLIAARNGVSDILKGRGSRVVLVFPVVYNYRQYLELHLKSLLLLFEKFQGDKTAKMVRGHRLSKIWLKLRPLILNQYPDYPIDELENVEDVIDQFMTVDPEGDAFRYPFGTSESNLADSGWNTVSIGALHQKMGDIHWALAGLAFEIKAKLVEKERSNYP